MRFYGFWLGLQALLWFLCFVLAGDAWAMLALVLITRFHFIPLICVTLADVLMLIPIYGEYKRTGKSLLLVCNVLFLVFLGIVLSYLLGFLS